MRSCVPTIVLIRFSFSLSSLSLEEEEEGNLLVLNASDASEGVYQCLAKNVAGIRASKKVSLQIQGEELDDRFMPTALAYS